MIGIIIIIVITTGYFIYKKSQSEKYVKKVLSLMRSKNNFQPELYQILANNSGAIAIDFNQRIICVIEKENKPFYLVKSRVRKTEILVDQDTYHKKDFVKTWGKFLLLKSLKSESSAEASVHIAKERQINKIKTLKLRIETTSLKKPNFYLIFLENGTEKHKRKIINDVYDWAARIESI
ncbi:MAG: hypothetical protein HWE22_19275 [Flavobacteriales bacterium]|nr:hypothetical protein [Flavobacteriales bacterium]